METSSGQSNRRIETGERRRKRSTRIETEEEEENGEHSIKQVPENISLTNLEIRRE